ncbi:MAG: hypothetical protein WBS24_09420 [Terriglobales bacterium]
MKRFLCLGAVLCLFVICAGCGETFRPIIIPNPPKYPNPAASHTVVTLNDNGLVVDGSAMVIDVSGDSIVSEKNVGLNPVYAVWQSASQVLAVNQSNSSLPQDSVTRLSFGGTVISNTSVITLPPSYNSSGNLVSAAPNFIATTEANQAYVLMPNYQPPNQNNIGGTIVPSVAVINTQQNALVTTLPVGAEPVAMAETPDGTKLYVANYGDGTISAFNTKDRSTRQICVNGTCPTGSTLVPLSSPPIWISARSDSQRVYVLEQDGTVAYIDTSSTAGPDQLYDDYSPIVQAPHTYYMWYDMILNRLYIPGDGQLVIVDVSQQVPQDQVFPGGIITPIPTVPQSSRASYDPCAATSTGTLSVVSVTSLPDGSRAYLGSFYSDGSGNVCPQVTVINTTNNTIKTATPVPGFPDATNASFDNGLYYVPVCTTTRDMIGPTGSGFRWNMAAAGDSSRAFLSSCDGGNVNIIYTSTDTYADNASAPSSARPPIPPSTQNPPQNPVFMLAGP